MRSRRLPSRRAAVAATLLIAAGLLSTGCSDGRVPAATPAASPLRYAALGDSYSSGVGAGGESGSCGRSDKGYPGLLAQDRTIDLVDFAACSGATTSDLVADQLGGLGPAVQLVTLTIGGNDLGVAALPAACAAAGTADCRTAIARSLSSLDLLSGRLATTYAAIAKAAPNARILVAGYPAFFGPTGAGSGDESAAAIDAAVASLDGVIERAVTKQRDAGVDIRYVDVSFDGHGVGSRDPWFVVTGPSAFHPDADGYVRYAQAIRDALPGRIEK